MALFGRGNDKQDPPPPKEAAFPLTPRKAQCSVCKTEKVFTKMWRRSGMMTKCPCCAQVFANPAPLYKRVQPACPRCEEPLEQPGFDYGLCDGCGSKFELIEGTKPGLIPNLKQRQERDKFGKSRSVLP
jgi:hypothetical protein